MLRYFYLLCLLICVEWTFCHNYNNEHTDSFNYGNVERRIRKGNNRCGNHKLRREDIVDVKNPMAQFDVSRFIRNPEEETYEDDKNKRISNYGVYVGLNDENIKKRDKSTDYSNLGTDNANELNINPPLYKDTINPRHSNMNAFSVNGVNSRKHMQTRGDKEAKNNYQNEYLIDGNIIHKPEKKCAFKHLKFPFFSHTKPVAKTKKEKTRKMFCANCSKNEQPNDTPQSNHFNADENKVSKRSYKEMLCPECKRTFILNDRLKHSAKGKIIHTSKQFYQNIKDFTKHKTMDSKRTDNVEINKDNAEVAYPWNGRRYREERDKIDKERRLKELDEVQDASLYTKNNFDFVN